MPTYTFPTNIAVGDLGQTTWANSVGAALNELGPLVDTKANDTDVVKLTGNQTVAGVKTFSSAPSVPDSSFAIAKVNGLQTALNGKISAFADPNADRIVFWDDSAGIFDALIPGTGLSISGTTITPVTASTTVAGIARLSTTAEATAGTLATVAVTPAGLKTVADTKANLASPALTGTPTTPTAAFGTNTTQIASTAFVQASIAGKIDSSILSAQGDIMYAPSAGVPGRLATGAYGTMLFSSGNSPVWSSLPSEQALAPIGGTFTSAWWVSSTSTNLRARDSAPMPIMVPTLVTIDQISFNLTTVSAISGQTAKIILKTFNPLTQAWTTGMDIATGIPLTGTAGIRSATITPLQLLPLTIYGFALVEEQAFDAAVRVPQGKLVGPAICVDTNYATMGLPYGTNFAIVSGVPVLQLRRSA